VLRFDVEFHIVELRRMLTAVFSTSELSNCHVAAGSWSPPQVLGS
jgi:hypothetical protein